MIICSDALTELCKLPGESVNCCVTSPPYWGLRDYGTAKWEGGDSACAHIVGGQVQDTKWPGAITSGQRPGVDASVCRKCGARRIDSQLGLERAPEEYVAKLVEVFREVRRVLRKDGTLWLNLGDCYHSGDRGGYHRARAGVKKNIGHSGNYNDFTGAPNRRKQEGSKDKDLVGIPWRVAFALQADGWWLRQDIIWAKPNPMPESVRDRCTKAHEYIFMFAKNGKTILWRAKDTLEWSHRPDLSEIMGYDDQGQPIKRWIGFSYWYDAEAVKEPSIWSSVPGKRYESHAPGGSERPGGNWRLDEPNPIGRNLRSVWTITTKPMPKIFGQEHFATFPPEIPDRCIKAGCPIGGVVLDPFFGAGTTGMVAKQLGRDFIGIELNQKYCEMAERRIAQTGYQPGLAMGNA